MDDPAVSLGSKQFGSTAALPIFAKTIRRVYNEGEFKSGAETILLNEKLDWTMPKNIVEVDICKETYEKATRFCPSIKEIYIINNQPKDKCKNHSSPFSRFKDK